MPIEDCDPHELTIRSSLMPYGCKDRVFKEGYWTLQRRFFEDGSFDLAPKFIKHAMSTECRYDRSLVDSRCNECQHRGLGELNSNLVRSRALLGTKK